METDYELSSWTHSVTDARVMKDLAEHKFIIRLNLYHCYLSLILFGLSNVISVFLPNNLLFWGYSNLKEIL